MNQLEHPEDPSEAAQDKAGASAAATGPGLPGKGQSSAPKPLAKEEQMARYEDDLKENDWGHQPC